jgi:hypothetical protein
MVSLTIILSQPIELKHKILFEYLDYRLQKLLLENLS